MFKRQPKNHRWQVPPVVFAFGLLLTLNAAAGAASFNKLEVVQQGDSYQIQADVYLDAPPQAVYSALIDFRHLPEINSDVRISSVLKVVNPKTQLVYTETEGCVFIFCRTIRQVQRFTEISPSDIVAVTLPGSGNLKQGMSSWHLRADGSGTRLSWVASIEPDFWVPPFIGARAIEHQLRSEALESMLAIERLPRPDDVISNAKLYI
jgi:hypothetical protein